MARNIAIIGSGPAGIYAAEALTKTGLDLSVFIIEALFCPYGLVRSGVAPDHQKIKEVSKLFDKTLTKENVHFLGNIEVGKDFELSDLKAYFDAIIICAGAHQDRNLGIPGENLKNVDTATNFVGWYNCHPWFLDKQYNLDSHDVVVSGQGNVAIDVSRILLKDPLDLEPTDISRLSLESLRNSKSKNHYMMGRRGPLQAAFTDKELKELGEISNLHINVDAKELVLTDEEQAWLSQAPKGLQRNYSILKEYSEREYSDQTRTLHIRFFLSPLEFQGETKITSAKFAINDLVGPVENRKAVPSGKEIEIKSDLVLKSVGYKGKAFGELPFDPERGVLKNIKGQIFIEGESHPYYFTSGWIKRGPSGVVGTNKADSVETVETLLSVLDSLPNAEKSPTDFLEFLKSKNIQVISFLDWCKLNQEEIKRGKEVFPRLKFTDNKEALAFLNSDLNK